MGTRHLILVYYRGTYHIAQYSQWDGYPSGAGADVLAWVRIPANIAKLIAALDSDKIYTPTFAQLEAWSKEGAADQREHTLRRNSLKGVEDYEVWATEPCGVGKICPTVSRDTSWKILPLVAEAQGPVPIVKDLAFVADSLFCEWAYVLDLDEEVLECWASQCFESMGWKEVQESDRFDEIEGVDEPGGLKLVGKWALCELPSKKEFLATCEPVMENEEENEEEKKEKAEGNDIDSDKNKDKEVVGDAKYDGGNDETANSTPGQKAEPASDLALAVGAIKLNES